MKSLITLIITLIALVNPVQNDPKAERIALLDKMFETLEQHIANPGWLSTDAYRSFKEKLYSEDVLSMNEEEFISLVNQERHHLPFTHFQLYRMKSSSKGSEKKASVTWEAMDEKTAYLKVRTFSSDPSAMIKAVEQIGTDTYENLIIDLRGTPGGTLDQPIILGQFLTGNTIDAGIFLTRKWFDEHHRNANADEISDFPPLRDLTFAGIKDMFQNEPAFRLLIPGHDKPVFQGNAYVLVDEGTGSACEPLIDVFKQQDIAVLVGSKSAGGMLSSASFPINEKYSLVVPTADYQTADARRIDKIGVEPDIEVNPDDALDYVLEKVIKTSN